MARRESQVQGDANFVAVGMGGKRATVRQIIENDDLWVHNHRRKRWRTIKKFLCF